jgi:ABC-2 type transport system permease protein
VKAVRLRRVAAIVFRHFYLIRGSLSRVFPMFVWVGIDMVLWGFISRYLAAAGGFRFNLATALLGAALLWDFQARVMQGVTMAFLEDVWSRNFLNVFASPLRLSEYLGGLVLSSIATSAVGLAVMLLVAVVAFGLSFAAHGLLLAAFLLVLFLFGIALGIAGSAVVLRLGPASEWYIWPIPAVLAPFACVFYPLATLPGWMRPVARLLPPSYVFEGMRAVVAGRAMSGGTLAGGALLALVYILVACWVFGGVHRYAVRTGLIARYAAESVS